MAKAPKKIYVMERNNSIVASAVKVLPLYEESKKFISADELTELPTYVTFARRLRLYGHLEFRSNIGLIYKWKDMKFTPKKSN